MGILLSDHFKVKSRLISDYSSFESMCVESSDCTFLACLVCQCRPPGQPTHFFEDVEVSAYILVGLPIIT